LPQGLKGLLRTPSGKFEFYSTALKQLVDKAGKQYGKSGPFIGPIGGEKTDDFLFLPAVSIPRPVPTGSFPLRLNTYRLMSRPMGGGRDQPWLLEQPAVHVHAAWESWVELHPKTAADLGVKDQDWVWVESAKGRVKLRVKLYSGTRPDVVHIPLFGGEGPNPNDLIANETDTLKGFGVLNTTQVRIRRV
jgi:anaerobic selenocysteine-containing dehydrogenase